MREEMHRPLTPLLIPLDTDIIYIIGISQSRRGGVTVTARCLRFLTVTYRREVSPKDDFRWDGRWWMRPEAAPASRRSGALGVFSGRRCYRDERVGA